MDDPTSKYERLGLKWEETLEQAERNYGTFHPITESIYAVIEQLVEASETHSLDGYHRAVHAYCDARRDIFADRGFGPAGPEAQA